MSPSRRRTLLYLAAVLFGGATAIYSIFWMYYAPQSGATRLGAELTYSLVSHALQVTSVVNVNGEEFGEKHLLDTVARNSQLPVAPLLQAIVSAVREFSNNAEQQDDITLAVTRSLG